MRKLLTKLLDILGLCPAAEMDNATHDLISSWIEIHRLDCELQNTKNKLFSLSKRPYELREAFAHILSQTDKELTSSSHYSVCEVEDGSGWKVVTASCCLGGCDMDCYTFPVKRDALVFAVLLDAVGYEPPRNTACSTCYNEYMKDCI